MNEYAISEINFYNGEMPIATIIDKITSKPVGYLGPFRGYKFQISATFEGSRNKGSSKVVGLGNVWTMNMGERNIFSLSNCDWVETKLELLKGLAMIAIDHLCVHDDAVFLNPIHEYTYSNGSKYWALGMLDHFINEVGIYLDKKIGTNFMDSHKM